ncbi:AraC family transcriptional regulator [Microbacterium sediminicola]|uniref:AraC family transcriptional regulator n=1 Tax=Microbacterium sediminicola TaxID=415210 RepID=UPI0031CEE730
MVVLEAESADGWEAVVSGCFVPLRCAGFESAFSGRMVHTSIDSGLSVSQVTTCGTSAERTARLADRAVSDDIHISLQRSSTGLVSQEGRGTSVGPGSVTVYATDRQYFLDYSAPDQEQFIMQVSRSSLSLPVGMLEDAMQRLRVPGGVGAAPVRRLFAYATTVHTDGVTESSAATMRDLTEVMVRASFGEGAGIPRTSEGLRCAVRDYFREHASESGIDMDQVAGLHLISRRRLYQVFEEVGESPAAILRSERLAAAQKLLQAPGERTIESIAYECGFRDVGTFTRAFSRTYGCTPRDYRATLDVSDHPLAVGA